MHFCKRESSETKQTNNFEEALQKAIALIIKYPDHDFTIVKAIDESNNEVQTLKFKDLHPVKDILELQIDLLPTFGKEVLPIMYAYPKTRKAKGTPEEKVYTKLFKPLRFEINKGNHYLVAYDIAANNLKRYLNLNKIRFDFI